MSGVLNALRDLGIEIEGEDFLPFSVLGKGRVAGGAGRDRCVSLESVCVCIVVGRRPL
ncbi:MAG: hypothetical protein V9G13_01890 [Marmoricola sp.]